MNHVLPELPWPASALEPCMSARTLELHHGKHHAGYVEKLNKLIRNTQFAEMTLEEIVLQASGAVFDNAAQHWNHSFFWHCLRAPVAGGARPDSDLRAAISASFDSFSVFKKKFADAAIGTFGSGWAWLVVGRRGGLQIVSTANAGSPLRDGDTPLLACDLWEHAYYLDYQNKRPDYVTAFWEILDWDNVGRRYAAARKSPATRTANGDRAHLSPA
jgi:Fe-Mn family superoxide dismutase